MIIAGCLFPLTIYAIKGAPEWKLKVSVEKANIRFEANMESPVALEVLKGTILESYEREGKWFRVVMGPDEIGYSVIGYIHIGDVEVIEERIVKEVNFWEEEPVTFRGIGLRIKLSGGLNFFFDEDIDKGTRGFYNSRADFFSSAGYTLDKRIKPFQMGYDFSGDIIFYIKPHVGIGVGTGYIYARRTDFFNVFGKDIFLAKFGSTPEIRVLPFKLGLFFSLPIHRIFSFFFNGGTALYLTEYSYFLIPDWKDLYNISQKANANALGLHGGIGLEFKLNQRTALLIEGQGRYVKISNFNGEETKYRWVPPGKDVILKEKGTLYYLEDEKYPYLAILKESPSGFKTIKKATFDLSGFCLRAGLVYRF